MIMIIYNHINDNNDKISWFFSCCRREMKKIIINKIKNNFSLLWNERWIFVKFEMV